jgi:F-type H+-transporting ATPase subunit epsilon
MDQPARMHLKVLLPFRTFAEKMGVSSIIAETSEGSFGILPLRLDCVAALAPGILTYANEEDAEVYIAVDEGVIVKTGFDVLVSVRNAIGGTNLEQLRATVERDFLKLSEQQKSAHQFMDKMESDLMRRLADLQRD